jgi:hypothetical protein
LNQSITIELHEATAEQIAAKFSGQANLITCASAPHFLEAGVMIPSIVRLLRPGGTLAVFTY